MAKRLDLRTVKRFVNLKTATRLDSKTVKRLRHGSKNDREARRSNVDMRSELMSGIKEAISTKVNCQVHAKVKVLGHLHRHGLIGKAINSVGISKLCCPACLRYISVMGIAILVRGGHTKWYPWHLCPDDELLSLDQLRWMKESSSTKRFQP